ncbi:hypothetical protein AAEP93_005823 [Penicillium crustosum]
MSERRRAPGDSNPSGQHVRAQLSTSVRQFLFCLTCVQLNVINWIQAGAEHGFGSRFEFRCVQDSGNSNDCQNCAQEGRNCEQVPAGIEGHRYELLSLIAWNHIDEHGIYSGCSRARRAHYRNWLLSRQPIPCAIELDGSPERFADFSLSKHKSIDTEDHVHNWYGAIRSFRQSVTRHVEDGVRGTIHQNDYAGFLGRFPDRILPAFPHGFQ